ncbi:MAG: hypothetical protein BWY59_00723 [Verrucomicrobia bacterium ADurb.Bin345]|nr:MAG: hypothetical protein BWY59_00723 [Verrucomicrobia bacterium ADurb.Bin345]
MPGKPADLCRDHHILVDREHRRQVRLYTIHSRVAVVVAADVQAASADTVRIPRRPLVVPLREPSPDVRVEGAVGDPVAALLHHHVVHQALAPVQHQDMQLVRRAQSVVHSAGGRDRRPRTLVRLDAAGPVVGQSVVRTAVHEFQAAAVAVRPPAPVAALAIGHLINGDPRLSVRIFRVVQLGEDHALSAVGQFPGVVAVRIGRRKLGIAGDQVRGVFRHDDVRARRHDRIRREGVVHAFREGPAADIHVARPAVVEFDVLVIIALRDRVVHDLVDNDVADAQRRQGVVGAGGARRQFVEARRSIRIPAHRGPVLAAFEKHGIHHGGPARALEVHGLPILAERESEFVRPEHAEPARADHRPARRDILVRVGIVREDAPRKIQRGRAVIVQLDIVVQRRIRMRDDLVDPQRIVRREENGVQRARRAPDKPAGGPRLRIAFPVRRAGKNQRRACAVRRDGPRLLVIVFRLEQERTQLVSQLDDRGAVRQVLAVRTQHPAHPVHGFHVGRHARDNQEAAAGDNRARGHRVGRFARDPVPADVRVNGVAVEELDELEVAPVRPRRGIVHDFRDRQRGLPARRAQGLESGHLQASRRAAGHGAPVAERGRHDLVIVVTGGIKAEVHCGRQGVAHLRDNAPPRPVMAGERREQVAHALQPQPQVGVIHRERARRFDGAAGTELHRRRIPVRVVLLADAVGPAVQVLVRDHGFAVDSSDGRGTRHRDVGPRGLRAQLATVHTRFIADFGLRAIVPLHVHVGGMPRRQVALDEVVRGKHVALARRHRDPLAVSRPVVAGRRAVVRHAHHPDAVVRVRGSGLARAALVQRLVGLGRGRAPGAPARGISPAFQAALEVPVDEQVHSDRAAVLQTHAADRRRGRHRGERAVRIKRLSRHDASHRPRINRIETLHAHLHVEVAGVQTVVEREGVSRPLQPVAAGREIHAACDIGHRARKRRGAYVLQRVFARGEHPLRA